MERKKNAYDSRLNWSCEPHRLHNESKPVFILTFDVRSVHCEHAHCLRSTTIEVKFEFAKQKVKNTHASHGIDIIVVVVVVTNTAAAATVVFTLFRHKSIEN